MHGAEASVTWRFLPNQQVTVMGDVVPPPPPVRACWIMLPAIAICHVFRPHRFGAEYQYTANQLGGNGGYQSLRGANTSAANESATSGYTLLDASVNYNFVWNGHDMMWFAKAQNLTNELAFVHSSFIKDDAPLAGRNLSVGLQARF